MKETKYYDFLEEENLKLSEEKDKIRSDFNLIFSILKELIVFLVKFPFYFILIIFNLITLNFDKSNLYLEKIFSEPFKLFSKFSNWFFEAKWTAYLILFLIFIYLLEFIIFIPLGIFDSLLFSSSDLFSSSFYTILTSIFIHADISHILGNLVVLLIFGRIVERQFGYKILFIFLFSAIMANFISGLINLYLNELSSSLGASGGIAGLIILAILLEPFAISSIFILPLPIFILGWFLISLDIIGITNPSSINNLAHIGGYLALLILFFFLEFKHRSKIFKGFIINLFMLAFIYFLFIYFNFNFELIFNFFL